MQRIDFNLVIYIYYYSKNFTKPSPNPCFSFNPWLLRAKDTGHSNGRKGSVGVPSGVGLLLYSQPRAPMYIIGYVLGTYVAG